jgi:hypothetical protein
MSALYKIPDEFPVYRHANLHDLSPDINRDGVHQITVDVNSSIDVLLQGVEGKQEHQKTALICFGGAVFNRIKKTGPFFSGTNIAKNLNVPLIAIADPTLSAFNVNLAWYAGNESFLSFQITLSKLIEELTKQLSFDNVIMFGGSGGGFACLVQAKLLKDLSCKVFVWNPQTSITKYFLAHVGNYIKKTFPKAINKINSGNRESAYKQVLDQSSIINSLTVDELSPNSELVYLQNLSDDHTERHLFPFMNLRKNNWERFGVSSFSLNSPKTSVYIGHWGEGHAVPPTEYIYFVLKGFLNNQSGRGIIQNLHETNLKTSDSPEFVDLETDNDFFVVKCAVNDLICKVEVELYPTVEEISFAYAYYLKSEGMVLGKHDYSTKNACIFDISSFDLNKLSIVVSLQMANGKEVAKEVALV